MKRFIIILLGLIFLHAGLMAKTFTKVKIGATWPFGYAIAHLEVEYFCVSDLLLIKDSRSKEVFHLKDSLDAVSFFADLNNLKQQKCLIKDQKTKADLRQALGFITGKHRLSEGCFYVVLSDGTYIYLGRRTLESDWFMYSNGTMYYVDQECADSFRWKYSPIWSGDRKWVRG